MTNWCTTLQTAISDEEFTNNNDSETFLTVATTRLETLFNDVAIVYNSNDERYSKYK